MFEKFQRGHGRDDRNGHVTTRGDGTQTAVVDRDRGVVDNDREHAVADRDRDTTVTGRERMTGTAAPATLDERRAVQREEYGGADGTAIFFGWLSALGLAALLMAVVAAAGTRLGLASGADTGDAAANAETIGIVGAAVLVGVLLLAYYAGGYVAGRMARFDGGRQGFRVWLLGLLVTAAAAVAGWIGGSEYNVLQQLNLPRIPVDEGTIATGAIITLAVVVIGTLLAAIAGGKAGDRYHLKVDRVGFDRDRL
jgi:hypothetical protein